MRISDTPELPLERICGQQRRTEVNLHAKIMNLNCVPDNMDAEPNQRLAYKVGHRDARHAAAELSLAADKLADALRDIAKQDPVEMALDPQWAARVARITLTECGYEA